MRIFGVSLLLSFKARNMIPGALILDDTLVMRGMMVMVLAKGNVHSSVFETTTLSSLNSKVLDMRCFAFIHVSAVHGSYLYPYFYMLYPRCH